MPATSEPREWVIPLPWPKPPLSMNDRMGVHEKARITRQMRETVGWLLRQQRIPALAKVRVQLYWTVPDERRRDDDNPAPTTKAIYDAFPDLKVVPDDTPQYMEKPTVKIVFSPGERGMHLRVTEIPD